MHIYVLSYYLDDEDDWDYVIEGAFATENLAKARMSKVIGEWIEDGHDKDGGLEDYFSIQRLKLQE